MVSLVHVLHRDVDPHIACLLVRNIADSFYTQTIIDVHCDLMPD